MSNQREAERELGGAEPTVVGLAFGEGLEVGAEERGGGREGVREVGGGVERGAQGIDELAVLVEVKGAGVARTMEAVALCSTVDMASTLSAAQMIEGVSPGISSDDWPVWTGMPSNASRERSQLVRDCSTARFIVSSRGRW